MSLDGEDGKLVGLNPGKAKTDIENINAGICGLQRRLVEITSTFFADLSNAWYSPKGIEFQGKVLPKIESINDQIIGFNDKTITKCVAAFNRLASAHGTGGISVNPGPYLGTEYAMMEDADPEGKVGMSVSQVKAIRENYVAALCSVVGGLSSVPSRIAFYDTDGAFAGACQSNVEALRALVEDATAEIRNLVDTASNEETARVEQGAQTAASQMHY